MTGVALSIMRNGERPDGANDFAEMEVMNITVVTSNEPYGVHDGSNPFFNGRARPKFNLLEGGVHSGHVLTGLNDPFCVMKGNIKGKCQVRNFNSDNGNMLHKHSNPLLIYG